MGVRRPSRGDSCKGVGKPHPCLHFGAIEQSLNQKAPRSGARIREAWLSVDCGLNNALVKQNERLFNNSLPQTIDMVGFPTCSHKVKRLQCLHLAGRFEHDVGGKCIRVPRGATILQPQSERLKRGCRRSGKAFESSNRPRGISPCDRRAYDPNEAPDAMERTRLGTNLSKLLGLVVLCLFHLTSHPLLWSNRWSFLQFAEMSQGAEI